MIFYQPLLFILHQQDYQHINTNNLVESWHATLKRQHMEHIRDMRGDDLIHLLTGVVDIDFRTHHFKVVHGLESIVLSEYDKAIKEKAMALPLAASKDMVAELDENNKVGNFFFCMCADL